MKVVFIVLMSFVCISTAQPIPPCIEAYRYYAFSECNEHGERYAFDYWNITCDSSRLGSPTLTEPRVAPCEMECPSGTFYSAKFIGCERCNSGEYSYTGQIITSFNPWPSNLVTYCSPQPCQAWQASTLGSYITSGNQSLGIRTGKDGIRNEAVVSTLLMVVNAVKYGGGRVSFTYRVESEEGFDGLALYINNTRQKYSTGAFLGSGIQHDWRTSDILLPEGTTEIRWTYEKDSAKSTFNSGRSGQDQAFITNIRIDGSVIMRDVCSQCPGGYKSVPTADRCELCPAETYAAPGSTKCLPCPSGTFSKAGAAACVAKPPCRTTDYVSKYSACDATQNTRTLQYVLSTNDCQESASTKMDPVYGQACLTCMVGKYLQDGMCIPCPVGQYMYSSCQSCGNGRAAVPSLTFANFDILDGNLPAFGFQTSCTGACPKGAGWEVFPMRDADQNTIVAIHSGSQLGATSDSILRLKSKLESTGYIKFKYFFFHRTIDPGNQVSGTFLIGNQPFSLDTTFNSPDNLGTFQSGLLTIGTYDFAWEFCKDYVDDQLSLVITSLEVYGDDRGGTSTCKDCFPGHVCSSTTAVMTPCPPGTFSDGKGSTCTPCPDGTIAPLPGSVTCQACPPSATSANGTSCLYSCRVTDGTFNYDLTPLKGKSFGPIFRADVMADIVADALQVERFYLKLCDYVKGDACQADGNAFVCSRFAANKTQNLGTSAVFQGNQYSGVTITYTGGGACESSARSTKVVLRCDIDQSNTEGKIRFVGEFPPCTYNFEILTPVGCPDCTMDSYKTAYTPCSTNGTQYLIWVKRAAAEGCMGGFQPPAPVQQECNMCKPEFYDAVWSGCDFSGMQHKMWVLNYTKSGCFEGAKSTNAPESRRCAQLELALGMNPATIVLIVFLILITLCVLAVIYMHKTKNSLLMKYENTVLKTISGANTKKSQNTEHESLE